MLTDLMALPSTARSFLNRTLSVDELRAVVNATVKAKHARVAKHHVKLAAAGDHQHADVVVHDGTLMLPELRLDAQPFLGLLVVRGDLVVEGLFADSLELDSLVIVTGDLRAERLISESCLEVHGSVVVEREALWLDNDGCAEIFGDLRAAFAYTKYHAVDVHGRVIAPLVLGDHPRIKASQPYPFIEETDEEHKEALRAVLPRDALAIESDPDDEDDWCIDYIEDDVLRKLVAKGKPVLSGPWPPKQPGKRKA